MYRWLVVTVGGKPRTLCCCLQICVQSPVKIGEARTNTLSADAADLPCMEEELQGFETRGTSRSQWDRSRTPCSCRWHCQSTSKMWLVSITALKTLVTFPEGGQVQVQATPREQWPTFLCPSMPLLHLSTVAKSITNIADPILFQHKSFKY